jgi:hypothetical protein
MRNKAPISTQLNTPAPVSGKMTSLIIRQRRMKAVIT